MTPAALAARIDAILDRAGPAARRARGAAPWPLPSPEPADVAALYAKSDGLSLPDGTRILPRGDLAATTAWIQQERSLDWPDDLVVLGEREDLVIVLDLDPSNARAGGGVLEAPTDDLVSFQRVALTIAGYLERRLGIPAPDLAPELCATEAASRRDLPALRAALDLPMYPGSDRRIAHAALVLGTLLITGGDAPAAIQAFERSIDARVRAAPRGAAALERDAALRACITAAREASAGLGGAEAERVTAAIAGALEGCSAL